MRQKKRRELQEREFADMVAALIHRNGEPTRPKYDEERFSLNGAGDKELRLRNCYDEYRLATKPEREKLLKDWTRVWFRTTSDLPAGFEDARSDLLPVIQRRGFHECEHPAYKAEEKRTVPCQTLGDHFIVEFAYDWPECKAYVTSERLDAWGVGFPQLLDVAIGNLRERTRGGLEEAVPGLWVSSWHDDYDVARILLPDLIERCEVVGSHVAMLLHNNVLLVTGSEDASGLEKMASFSQDSYEIPRFVSGVPLVLSDGWRPFELPETHPLCRRYQSLWHLTMATDYPRQGDQLQDHYRRRGEGLFVAAAMLTRNAVWPTVTCWTDGVDSLLPRTAAICLQTVCRDDMSMTFYTALADWETVQNVVGDLMEPVGLYPERYRVRSFPAPEQLEVIKASGPNLVPLLRQDRRI